MATGMAHQPAPGLVNGASPSPPPAEKEKLYDQLLRMRDVVLTGKHAQFKLPPSAVEQLKASLLVPPVPASSTQNGALVSGQASFTNAQQPQTLPTSSSLASYGGLPGLQNAAPATLNGAVPRPASKPNGSGVELDPIFLQKSENLVREETRLKRQRLERDLQIQLEYRRLQSSSRDKDPTLDAPSRVDISLVLRTAMDRVKHVSGLKTADSPASSSFDENDYYSSLVESDWPSSEKSSTKGSDRATGGFTADFERLDGSTSKPKRKAVPASTTTRQKKPVADAYTGDQENMYDMDEDDDDEYLPPDAAAFDSSRIDVGDVSVRQPLPDDDDSDYEPGEIIADESFDASPSYQQQQQMPPPANVPVIRNHLTHIAAPQPNRVSPLTTTKDSNIELELVNGRPEVVHKSSYQNHQMSRVSSASPTGHSGPGAHGRKQKQKKKRKRDNEPQGRNKRRQKQAEMEPPRSPVQQETYIKAEPISPTQSMANLPPAPEYGYAQPPQVDVTPHRAAPYSQYLYGTESQYHYAPAEPQQVIRVASPAHRPYQRDNQDLRRVASFQSAMPTGQPHGGPYSPIAPYRPHFRDNDNPRQQAPAPVPPHDGFVIASNATHLTSNGDQRLQAPMQDPRPRSPNVAQRYDDTYSSRAASPALMPPPPAPATQGRRIVQDQHGNRYYAADSAPSQLSSIRASAVPESFERAPSRASYAPAPPPPQYYERVDERIHPSQQHSNGVEEPFEYTDADGYLVRGYRIRPADRPQQQQPRYSEVPTSPAYQEYKPYDAMPPPPAPPSFRQPPEPTSPTYDASASRSYSVRPEQPAPPQPNYLRQASVAPVQFAPLRQGSVAPVQYTQQQPAPSAAPAPQRAMSVMPGYQYASTQQHPSQQAAPRFVDQYGNPVYPREVREVRQVDDYYHA